MQSTVMKEIKSLDKSMRDKFTGFPLFQVAFGELKSADEEVQEVVLEWYKHILSCEHYESLRILWNENDPHWWHNVRTNSPGLPEYCEFNYRKSVFVEYCKQTMPSIIRHKDKRRS